ncbi:hypothetical protein [Mesorhizobium sp. B1-1-8]|uniref:hypothetical protein n=1 Tax=Mesorhizobium sp. B1-1-8 TaxID=2589976 RepID=UPI0015E28901|nr:hypothetical protein [Mesorhizobium sp. B1-1-8]
MATISRTAAKAFYYARNFARDAAPQAFFRSRLTSRLQQARLSDKSVRDRVNYYNKLEEPFVPSPAAVPVNRLPFSPSMYYYDLKEFARYFDPGLLVDLEFGDVTGVPGRSLDRQGPANSRRQRERRADEARQIPAFQHAGRP